MRAALLLPKVCPACAKRYQPKKAVQRFCSMVCAHPPPGMRVCEACGEGYKSRHKEQRFCSLICAGHRTASLRPDPDWYAEARKLRKAGLNRPDIARALGRTLRTVEWALDEDGFRDKHKANVSRQRHKQIEAQNLEKRAIVDRSGGGEKNYFSSHAYRTPRQRLDREAVMPAARLFAAGKISIRELMARITVRE